MRGHIDDGLAAFVDPVGFRLRNALKLTFPPEAARLASSPVADGKASLLSFDPVQAAKICAGRLFSFEIGKDKSLLRRSLSG